MRNSLRPHSLVPTFSTTPSPTTRGGQKGENNCGDVLQLLDLLFTCIIESLYTLSGPQGASSVEVVTQFDIDHVAPLGENHS